MLDATAQLHRHMFEWHLASNFVPVGSGIKKLRVNLVIEDDKVSLDELEDQIEEFEDEIQFTIFGSELKL